MSEEATKPAASAPAKEAPSAAGHGAAGGEAPKDAPVRKEGPGLFSKKMVLILAAVTLVEGASFSAFLLMRGKSHAQTSEKKEESQEEEQQKELENTFNAFKKVGRHVLDAGEIKVPITSTQPRAPRSITATFLVVVGKEIEEKLSGGGGGGHGGGGKNNPLKQVLILNIRSIIRGMMDSDGIRLVEPSAKADLERRAKDQLNNAKIDGDEEKAQVLKILRGQVLQVIIDKFDIQSF